MDRAVRAPAGWAEQRDIDGLALEVVELEGRTPVLLAEVPGTAPADDTVLLYGHLDKQPEMIGWRPGLGPWEPVLEGDRLYGRGGRRRRLLDVRRPDRHRGGAAGRRASHARCVVLIEGSEESGSPDLPAYVDHLAPRLGPVGLVVCLDSFCNTYDRLWATTSLRGLLNVTLRVAVLHEGVHSGASGMLPSTFRIARQLLERVEESATGASSSTELHVEIPSERLDEAREAAAVLGERLLAEQPAAARRAARAVDDPAELLFASTWRPALEVVGADGLPADHRCRERPAGRDRPQAVVPAAAVLPTLEPARERSSSALTEDPPYGAHVDGQAGEIAAGWAAPATAPWLADALAAASGSWFGGAAGRRSASAAPSPSCPCSASASPTRSSWWSVCSGPNRTPTAPTSSSTCRPASALTGCRGRRPRRPRGRHVGFSGLKPGLLHGFRTPEPRNGAVGSRYGSARERARGPHPLGDRRLRRAGTGALHPPGRRAQRAGPRRAPHVGRSCSTTARATPCSKSSTPTRATSRWRSTGVTAPPWLTSPDAPRTPANRVDPDLRPP